MQQFIKTKNIGRKFNADGSVRFFPGNTVISKIHEDSEIYPFIREIKRSFQKVQEKKYAYLPDSSFHMTIIQGVCDEDRKKELWSSFLGLDIPLEQVDGFFENQFKKAGPLGNVRMAFDRVDTDRDIVIVRFSPAGLIDRERLEAYRDRISELFGICFPDHHDYGFHVSVAYKLWSLSDEEEAVVSCLRDELNQTYVSCPPVFTLKEPELTFFENMFEFCSHRIAR